MVQCRWEGLIKQGGQLNGIVQCKTRKRLINKETDNKFDKKALLKWLALKWKIMSGQAWADKGLNMVADKTRTLDVIKINSWINPISIC